MRDSTEDDGDDRAARGDLQQAEVYLNRVT